MRGFGALNEVHVHTARASRDVVVQLTLILGVWIQILEESDSNAFNSAKRTFEKKMKNLSLIVKALVDGYLA